jgi:hypothetical protein
MPTAVTPDRSRFQAPFNDPLHRAARHPNWFGKFQPSPSTKAVWPSGPGKSCRPRHRDSCHDSRASPRRSACLCPDTPPGAARNEGIPECSKAARSAKDAWAVCHGCVPAGRSRSSGVSRVDRCPIRHRSAAWVSEAMTDGFDDKTGKVLHMTQKCFNGELNGGCGVVCCVTTPSNARGRHSQAGNVCPKVSNVSRQVAKSPTTSVAFRVATSVYRAYGGIPVPPLKQLSKSR